MAATELAVSYVSIVPETSKIAPGVAKALVDAERGAGASGKRIGSNLFSGLSKSAGLSSKKFSTAITSSLTKHIKRGAIGVGVAAGGAISIGLKKGLGRLSAIEVAESKLKGLGNSARDMSGIMQNALASVRGTAYGLEEAATVAASAVAAGVKPGQDLERTLKLVADAATISGRDMESMGLIVNKVLAKGKVQGQEIMQLSQAGIPITQLLAKQMGVTAEAVMDLVSQGKIGAKEFLAAIEDGMGGAALRSGETTVGAFKNMGAAASRLAATLTSGLFGQSKTVFQGITKLFDKLDAKATPVMGRLNKQLTANFRPALQAAGTAVKSVAKEFAASFQKLDLRAFASSLSNVFKSVASAAAALLPPVVSLAGSLSRVTASISLAVWHAFADVLQAVAKIVEKVVAPVASFVAKLASFNPTLTAAAGSFAFLALKVKGLGTSVLAATKTLGLIAPALKAVGAALTGPVGLAIAGVVTALGGMWMGWKRNNEALEESKEAAERAADGFDKLQNQLILSGGEMNDAMLDSLAESLQNAHDATAKLADSGGIFGGLKKEVNEAQKVTAGFEKVQEELGITSQEAFRAIAEGGDSYDRLIDAASQLGFESRETVAHIEQLRARVEDLRDMVAAADATDRFAAAMNVLGDAAASADEKLTAFQHAIAAVAGRDLNVEQSTAALAAEMRRSVEAHQEAATAAAQHGEVLVNAAGDIDVNTEAGNRLYQSLLQTSGALYENIEAMHQAGESHEALVAKAREVHDGQVQAAMATGMSSEQAKKLADNYVGVPDEVVTMVTNPGLAKAYSQVAEYKNELQSVPGSKSVIIDTKDEDAKKKLKAVGFEVENLKGGKVKISAEDDELQAVLNKAKNGVFKFEGLVKNKKPKLEIDTKDANNKLDTIKQKIDGLPSSKTVNITVQETKVTGGKGKKGYAKGGFIPRNAATGRDTILGVSSSGTPIAWVDAGEHITRREMTAKYSQELAEINAGTFPKLPGYRAGGVVGHSLSPKVRDKLYPLDLTGFALGRQDMRSVAGAKYVYGGRGWGDNLAMPIALARRAAGLSPFGEVPHAEELGAYLTSLGAKPGKWKKGMLGISYADNGASGTFVQAQLPTGEIVYMLPGKGGVVGGAPLSGLTSHYVLPASNPLAVLAGVQNLPDQLLDEDGTLLEGDELKRAIEETGGARGLPKLLESSGTSMRRGDSLGSVLGTALKGQITDFLSVFGIEARTPPIVTALLQLAGMGSKAMGGDSGASSSASVMAGSLEGAGHKPSRDEIARSMVATTPRYKPGAGVAQWRETALAALEWLGMSTNMVDKVLAEIAKRSKGNTNFSGPAPLDENELESQENHAESMRTYRERLKKWEESGGKDSQGNPVEKPKKPKGPGEKEFKDATIHGLMGLTPAEFFSNVDSELPRQIYHPLANLVAGLKLMDSDYASLEMLWGEMQHFAKGGKVKPNPKLKRKLKELGIKTGGDDQIIGAKTGEMVMNEAAVAGNQALLESMNKGISLDERSLRAAPANMALDVYDKLVPQLAGSAAASLTTAAGSTAAGAVRAGGKLAGTVLGRGGQAIGGVLAAIPGAGAVANAVVGATSGVAGDVLEAGAEVIGTGIEALTPMAAEIAGMGAQQVAEAGSRMMHAGVDTLNTVPTLTEMVSAHSPAVGQMLAAAPQLPTPHLGGSLVYSQTGRAGGDTFVFNAYNVEDSYSKFNGVMTARAAGMGVVL